MTDDFALADLDFKRALLIELEAVVQDYKVGVVAAELSDNGVSIDAFYFRNQSTFKRPVSRDIEDIYWSDTGEAQSRLVFLLNREGIYDMLPEAMVHSQAGQKREEGATKSGNELRRQEKDARSFFGPLENEFHCRSLKLDTTERELLKYNNPQRNREFFHYFFEDSRFLTDQQLLMLMHILPLSHKIRGDPELIGLTLTRILNYKVTISSSWRRRRYLLPEAFVAPLGSRTLGVDTILGDSCSVPARYYTVTVDGISTKDFPEFCGTGRHINVLNFILPYFFPVNADFGILLECIPEASMLVISDGVTTSFLGFNSYI